MGGTPDCKVNNWQDELKRLRQIVLNCGLTEELKWSMPCYTFEGNNILIMSAFKEYCAISFFKGSLLNDPDHILDSPGENSQATRLIRITKIDDISQQEDRIKSYIKAAIEIEKAGLKVNFKSISEFAIPEELQTILDKDSRLKTAFEALTAGRQRSYILHISAAKQKETRESRAEKCIPKILEGKGFNERY
ncbi:MAG: YdeI/OmpD-associated family protein [Calditrichaeota bacterium]|nr:YdeI/OmpD-associated family protein [Calditrichota bacterium]